MSEIRVEFYGVARTLAGCDWLSVKAATVADLIPALTVQCPKLASNCFEGGKLSPHWILNIDGRFVRDFDVPLNAATPVLLMSADAGG